MSKHLFSLEYTLPNIGLHKRANKEDYRAKIAQIQSNGGPISIVGDPEEVNVVAAAGAALKAEASTSLIFCYTDKFNQPTQIINVAGWQTTRFINQDEQYSAPAVGAAGPAGGARNDVIVKWETGIFSHKMNYERPKNVFVLEGMKDFGGSRGDVDLLGSVEDHAKLITEIKKLFPNGENLIQPHPDEVCDEWLTTPPNASDTFWGNEIKKKGIEKGKDEKVLEAARGTGLDPEMLRIIKYLHEQDIRKFLFDAGIKKIGANVPIKISEGVSINPKKDFYYTASFDAAPEIAGYGVGIFKQPPFAFVAAPPAPAADPEALEKEITRWVTTNIIDPLEVPAVAGLAVAPAIEGYFIQPGLDCDRGYLFEISVYTKNASGNLDKMNEKVLTQLRQMETAAVAATGAAAAAAVAVVPTDGEAEAVEEAVKEVEAVAAAAMAQANELTNRLLAASKEAEKEYNALRAICVKLEDKLSILRYLVFLPKNSAQEAIISVSIPSKDYELSITQARYNYKSFQHPDEAIKILPFNDCKFYQKIKGLVSDTEKAAFCVLQKWNCDQNDAILNALVPNSCLLSVDKPAIAATIARGGNAFLLGDKLGNGIYNNKKFYKILPAAGAGAAGAGGAEDDNYKIFPNIEEQAEQVAAAERKRRRKDAANAKLAASRALAAQAAQAAAAGGMADGKSHFRHRYSRKPNKARRRSTRKHKN